MARLSQGGSGKKSKSKSGDASIASDKSREEEVKTVCNVSVAFQNSSSTSDDCSLSDVLISANHMSTLRLRPGSYICICTPSGMMLCRAWLNRKAVTECVVLNKSWQGSVDDKKSITLDASIVAKSRLIPCSSITIYIDSSLQEVRHLSAPNL